MFDHTSLKSRTLAVAAAVVAFVLVAASGRAEAQISGTGGTTITGTGGSGGTAFAAGDFFVGHPAADRPAGQPDDVRALPLLQQGELRMQTPVNVFIALLSSGIAKRAKAGITTGTVSIVLGTRVQLGPWAANRTGVGACLQIATEQVLTFLNQASYTVSTDARRLSTYFNATGVIVDGGTRHRHRPACTAPTGQTFTQTSTSTSTSAAATST